MKYKSATPIPLGYVPLPTQKKLTVHSFLPAFKGANPYKKAFERGVKLIGATAHIVNDDLDEGPIITQKIIPVHHYDDLKDMIESGHEIEKSVLADALKMVLEDRIFVSGNKTIIFS